jgi:hypothetical protein
MRICPAFETVTLRHRIVPPLAVQVPVELLTAKVAGVAERAVVTRPNPLKTIVESDAATTALFDPSAFDRA